MANVKIPEEATLAFQILVSFDDTAFESFLAACANARPTLTARQFSASISKVLNTKPEDVLEILAAILPLFEVMEEEKISTDELATGIGNSAREELPEIFSSEKIHVLIERLKKLLDLNKPLGVIAKAVDVITDHQHFFCAAKILSDIRPIFTDNAETASAAVIIHNLQIGYHDSAANKHTEFYVALDMNDIMELKEVIARAERKTLVMKSMLEKSGTHYLEP